MFSDQGFAPDSEFDRNVSTYGKVGTGFQIRACYCCATFTPVDSRPLFAFIRRAVSLARPPYDPVLPRFIENSMTKEKLLAMPADDYMNAEQHAYFTTLLKTMKVETQARIDESRIAIESLDSPADPADAASVEEERHWLVNAIERDQRMLPQLEQALDRIADDSFGWCEDSGEPIGLKRLLISPTTKYCIEAQERHEQLDRHQRQA